MSSTNLITSKEIVVKRFASDYSHEELLGIKKSFKPVAEMSRRRQKISNAIVLTIILALVISVAIPEIFPAVSVSLTTGFWIFGGLLACLFSLLIANLTPLFKCPACENRLYNIKKYCPECGNQLPTVRHFPQDGLRCEKCNKNILIRKGKRYFKIKFCTFCAVKLDDQGV